MNLKTDAFDFAMSSQQLDCIKALNQLFEKTLGNFGFNQYLYSTITGSSNIFVPTTPIGKIDPRWQHRYYSHEYFRFDLCIYFSQIRNVSFTWSEVLTAISLDNRHTPKPSQGKKIINEASEYNLNSGLTLPLQSLDGTTNVVTLMGSEHSVSLSKEERFALEMTMTFYAGAIERISHNEDKPLPVLTGRQRDILSYIAKGKRYDDISGIIGITPKTIRRHMEDARHRLNVVTTAQLVAEAIKRHEITP